MESAGYLILSVWMQSEIELRKRASQRENKPFVYLGCHSFWGFGEMFCKSDDKYKEIGVEIELAFSP